ncbi:MAG: response regulator [Burkholderiales bacterium]
MRRILVIDDSQDTRELMQLLLEHAGYTVEVAPDGAAGLRAQHARPADLVITDIFMPKQDGIETIAELRRTYPDLKVIAISGGGEVVKNPGYLRTAREIGAHAVLAKPFEIGELLRTVQEVLA